MTIHDEKMIVAQNMKKYGGVFISRLGEALIHADATNAQRLKDAFPTYWEQYLTWDK